MIKIQEEITENIHMVQKFYQTVRYLV